MMVDIHCQANDPYKSIFYCRWTLNKDASHAVCIIAESCHKFLNITVIPKIQF